MPVSHTAFPLELWHSTIFLLVSTLKYSTSPNQTWTRLFCKNLISLRKRTDPKSCIWGNVTDTFFSALSYASKYIFKKSVPAIFMIGLIFLDISESCWGHAYLTWILLFLFIEAAHYTTQGFKHSPFGTTGMHPWDAGAFSKVAIKQGLGFVLLFWFFFGWLFFIVFVWSHSFRLRCLNLSAVIVSL